MLTAGIAILVLIFNAIIVRFARRSLPGVLLLLMTIIGSITAWYYVGIGPLAINLLNASLLPILTYSLLSFGETMIIMRASMVEVLNEEYVSAARAKGLATKVVREKHAARNAILPVISRLVISLPYLLTGIVIIEDSIGRPGIGTLMWDSLYWQDMPTVMDLFLIVGLLSLAARLVLDIITAYLDPRIRFSSSEVRIN